MFLRSQAHNGLLLSPDSRTIYPRAVDASKRKDQRKCNAEVTNANILPR